MLGSKGVLQNHRLRTVPATGPPRASDEDSDFAWHYQLSQNIRRASGQMYTAAKLEHAHKETNFQL